MLGKRELPGFQTARVLMQLKDQQLRPLWVDGLAPAQPTRLLGFPVSIWEQLDDVDVSGGANSTFPVSDVVRLATAMIARMITATTRLPGRFGCGV
jgi:HK97 family phage major capsid protein